MRSSAVATLATNGAGQPGGNVTGTNAPPGGAEGHTGQVGAVFQARDVCGGVAVGAGAAPARGSLRAAVADATMLPNSSARRAVVGRAPTAALVRSSASAIAP